MTTSSRTSEPASLHRQRAQYAEIPDEVLFGKISDRAVVIYAILDLCAKDGIRPAVSTLATRARCTEPQVHAALVELANIGAIEVES